jgi:hypothetical protein
MNNTSTNTHRRKKKVLSTGGFNCACTSFSTACALPDNAISCEHHHHHIHIAKDLRLRDFRQTFSTTTPTEAICDGQLFQSEGEVKNKQPMVAGVLALTELSPSLFPCMTREVSDVLRDRGTAHTDTVMGRRSTYTRNQTDAS